MHTFLVVTVDRTIQWVAAVCDLRSYISLPVQQQFNHLDVAVDASLVQWGGLDKHLCIVMGLNYRRSVRTGQFGRTSKVGQDGQVRKAGQSGQSMN